MGATRGTTAAADTAALDIRVDEQVDGFEPSRRAVLLGRCNPLGPRRFIEPRRSVFGTRARCGITATASSSTTTGTAAELFRFVVILVIVIELRCGADRRPRILLLEFCFAAQRLVTTERLFATRSGSTASTPAPASPRAAGAFVVTASRRADIGQQVAAKTFQFVVGLQAGLVDLRSALGGAGFAAASFFAAAGTGTAFAARLFATVTPRAAIASAVLLALRRPQFARRPAGPRLTSRAVEFGVGQGQHLPLAAASGASPPGVFAAALFVAKSS